MSSWDKCVRSCDRCGEIHDQQGDCDCDRTRRQLHLAYGGMFLFTVGFGIVIWYVFTYVFIDPQAVFLSPVKPTTVSQCTFGGYDAN